MLQLDGALQAEVLRRTLTEIIRRHEPLRTTFPSVDGKQVAEVAGEPALPLPLTDLSALSPDERERELGELLRREAGLGFDLARGPLFRARLVRLAEDRHVLMTSTHHTVFDGWSRTVFNRELSTIYDAFAQGRESPLPPVTVPFSTLAEVEEQWLESGEARLQLEYWKKMLAGVPPLFSLPYDHPRPRFQNLLHGARHLLELPEETQLRLGNLANQSGTTRFIALLSGFGALLYRYTGRNDIVLGMPIAGHARAELPDLIGLLVNTVVLRAEVTPNLSFRDLLARMRGIALDAIDHGRLPFYRIVEALRPDPDLGCNPVFQIVANGIRVDHGISRMHGLEITPIRLPPVGCQFDLGLFIEDSGNSATITFDYNTDLFDPGTIARMAGHYRNLLEAAVADPDCSIADLPMLTAVERTQMAEWNATSTGQPADACVVHLVEQQVRLTPDAIAVECGTERLTYRELDDRACRLADRLRGMGTGPEKIVAICMERSPEMVVALLGTWKAGGAWLPLDPSYPSERLAFMLGDAQADVLLTQERLVSILPSTPARVLRLDSEWASIASASPVPAKESAQPGHLAYVIYTSGSTGKPKGVAIEHRALANHMLWMKEHWPLSEADTVIQKTPVSADASVWEFWAPLISGARLVLAGPDDTRDPARLAEVIHVHGVTVLQAVPSLLSVLVDEPGFAKCTALRLVFAGGEPLTPELHARFVNSHPASLCNLYGPTEATIDATFWISDRDPGRQTIPIGQPVANTTAHVLDPNLNPVPVGVPGELHIGGAALARGYLRRPNLTSEKFIPSPFSPHARLYRTGDLARRLPDGTIEFLGRLDHQIKLRGFRFEPGEVEAVLEQHPAVRQGVAIIREDNPGNRQLVAYVRPTPGCSVTADELRQSARRILPEFMIPSAFVVLDSFPLTPNGKVDRLQLPAPDRLSAGDDFVPPRTAAEEQLARIWGAILGDVRIGAETNFFDLGGHSLLATQVVSRTRSEFACEVSVADLFRNPTLAGFAEVVATKRTGMGRRDEPPPATSAPADAPLSSGQESLWFLEKFSPSATYNTPYLWRMRGTLEAATLDKALRDIIRRHESLRTVYPEVDGVGVQRVAPDSDFHLRTIDLRVLPQPARDRELNRIASEEAKRPFDLANGPVIRAVLMRLDGEEHALLLCLHHITMDMWSMGILLRELGVLYQAFLEGRPSTLPDLPIQYAQYAIRQRSMGENDVIAPQLDYWRRTLSGHSFYLDLPTDRPRPAMRSNAGGTCTVALPAELAPALEALAREENASLFMTLLAAYSTLLHRYTHQDDILVASPISRRDRVETEPLIGFFLNTLIFSADFAGQPMFRELLRRVRDTALEAFSNQDVPIERIVEVVQPSREHGQILRPPAMFVLTHGSKRDALKLPGVVSEPIHIGTGTAKCDLLLAVTRTEEGLVAAFEFSADLFDPPTIRRMAGHFETLLRSIAECPDTPVSGLSLLTPAETQSLLTVPAAAFPDDATLDGLFEEQAARTPDAPAVVLDSRALTYREVNALANQIAHKLRPLLSRTGEPVGIVADRSPEAVAGVLGILRAGGACLPLDPSYPPGRLAMMLAESGARIILSHGPHPFPQAGVCWIDLGADDFRNLSLENPGPGSRASDPAYVLFTSGSTGTPKGVLMPHRPLCNLVTWQTRRSTLPPGAKTLQFASLNFDVSFQEIFSTLTSGGTLVLIPDTLRRDPTELVRIVAGQSIARLFLPVVALEQFAVAFGHCGIPLPALREVIVAGEQLRITDAVRQLFSSLAHCRLDNHYGPTESHVVTAHRLTGDPAAWPALPPIGRPVANACVLLLDQNRQPVPAGATGEIFIGGTPLADGYMNRPDLTAERFIEVSLGAGPALRLYRTGDLARALPNGDIAFLGRSDDQVKIRGFRVEPGEIETLLTTHPQVRQAAVSARDFGSGDRRLSAYVVADTDVPADELRSFLELSLPEYMLPSVYVFLDALPLTPSGKIDRRALPEPENFGRSSGKSAFAPPEAGLETQIAEAWADVLKIEHVGRHDNFFQLGGHSLVAVTVISRLREALALDLPLRLLFEHPNIAAFSEAVEAFRHTPTPAGKLPRIRRMDRPEKVPSPFHAETWRWLSHVTGAFVYQLDGALDAAALERAVNELAARHEILRTTFREEDVRWFQHIEPAGPQELHLTDLTAGGNAEEEARQIVDRERRRGIDPTRERPVRMHILRIAERKHWLLLLVHHCAYDEWSMGILLRELAILYDAFLRDEPSPLPPPELQFADLALWRHEWIEDRGNFYEEQIGYWEKQLGGGLKATDLPLRPGSAARSAVRNLLDRAGQLERFRRVVRNALNRLRTPRIAPDPAKSTIPFVLAPAPSRALRELSQREGVTVFTTLLAAFKALLHATTGETDIVIRSLTASRDLPGLEGIVGYLADSVLLRTSVAGNPTFPELLKRVRETVNGALAHQAVPNGELADELRRRGVEIPAEFPVVFQVISLPWTALSLAGVSTQAIDLPTEVIPYGFQFVIADQGSALTGYVKLNTTVYNRAAAVAFLNAYRLCLEAIAANPAIRFSELGGA